MGNRVGKQPPIRVTQDDDGGVTIHCPQTGIVFSLIESRPDVTGTKMVALEIYPYATDREISSTTQVEFGRHLRQNLWTTTIKEEAHTDA